MSETSENYNDFEFENELLEAKLEREKLKLLVLKSENTFRLVHYLLKKYPIECAICKDNIDCDYRFLYCNHLFHTLCLDKVAGNSCPLCRAPIDYYKLC